MSKLKIALACLAVTLIFYGTALRYGFSQDDWYFLFISQADSWQSVLAFLAPWQQQGFAFFRPLSTQLYYWFATSLFGQSVAPRFMHVLMLLLQAGNAYLVFQLLLTWRKGRPLSFMVALLYAGSSVHFLSLYYIAATQQLLSVTFSLLSLTNHLKNRSQRSGLWFLLALLSKETAIVTPIIAYLLDRQHLRRWFWFAGAGALYLLWRLTGNLSTQAEYQLFIGPSVLTNLRWYWLFGFGAPEELVRYGLPRMGINLAGFVRDYGWSGLLLAIGSFSLATVALIRAILSGRYRYVLWVIVGLLPVLFLRDHLYPHYLDLALIPLLLIMLESLPRRLQFVLVGLYFSVSWLSVRLSEDVHWTTNRAQMATQARVSLDWTSICNSSNVVFVGEGVQAQELSYTLSGNNGPRILCQNPALEVYYAGVDVDFPSSAQPVDIHPIFDSL